MGLFGKSKGSGEDDRPLTRDELMERSKVDGIRYNELQVVHQLAKLGYNLRARRHVLFFLYFPEEQGARAVAEVLRGRDHEVKVREPGEKVTEWAVIAESHDRALIPDFLRDTVDLCEELATTHGGTYDGWEAGPDLE